MRYQQADYAAALADGGKRQTLLNIVKLRYGDVPAFVSVSQILAGYSLQGTFSAGTELLTGGSLRLSDDANVGVGGTFTNSPTVTYAPVTGADFARTFLAPLQPADLFGLMLAGVPPELVLGPGPALDRRLRQRARRVPSGHAAADPSFAEVLALLLELQRSGPACRSSSPLPDSERVACAQDRRRRHASDAPERRLRELLALPADRTTFEVVYTLGDARPGQIAIRTRSLIEVLGQLAADIDVPEGDVADGRTYAAIRATAAAGAPARASSCGTACSSRATPSPRSPTTATGSGSPTTTSRTKRVFSFVMLLLSLSESSRPGQPPVITHPGRLSRSHQRQHHVRRGSAARASQPRAIGGDVGQVRPGDVEIGVAPADAAHRDVAHGERVAGDEGPIGQMPVEDASSPGRAARRWPGSAPCRASRAECGSGPRRPGASPAAGW